MNYKIFYRINNDDLHLPKIPGASKLRCLDNFISVFGNTINVLANNCDEKTINELDKRDLLFLETNLNKSDSFLFCLSQVKYYSDDTIVYFVEDDYLHLPNSKSVIQEGVKIADYISLYDDPDKYGPIYDHGEYSKVMRTKSSHWRNTISTCMTFAAKAETIKKDFNLWQDSCTGDYSNDQGTFSKLFDLGRKLAISIPGMATHANLHYSLAIKENFIEPWAIQMMMKEIEKNIYSSHDGDGIEMMEDILHRQRHELFEKLTLISNIENNIQTKKSE